MIGTAADYGIGVNEAIESARLWGRMYKDQNTVNLLTAQSAKLAGVERSGAVAHQAGMDF